MTGPLERGRRRSRAGRIGALLALLAAAAGVALVTVVVADRGPGSPRATGSSPTATGAAGAVTPAVPPAANPARRASAVSLAGPDAFSVRLERPPRAGLVFDLRSGGVLWRRSPLERLPIASLAKIMTAIVVVEETSRRERVRISRAALGYSGSGMGVLPRGGRRVPIEGLLAGLLLVSGNDAAIALAEHVGGSERRFVGLMNARARRLGLRCTRFASPSGLEDGDRSCAADLAALARVAMRKRRIARLVRRAQLDVPFPIKGGRLYLNSTNPLLRSRYRGAIGLKTGSTRRAGHSFVGVARRRGRTLGVVLLRSPDSGGQARKLLDRGFRTSAAGY
ncbi:MAG: serine hydrolase [Actinomycetota bacterium]|nr:serine hydrolase [Actinomycetota bacterium]